MADCAADGRFVVRAWDDGIAVFDRHSGATHCMNAAAATVFRLVVAMPSVADSELLHALRLTLPQASAHECEQALSDARHRLVRAGLMDEA